MIGCHPIIVSVETGDSDGSSFMIVNQTYFYKETNVPEWNILSIECLNFKLYIDLKSKG